MCVATLRLDGHERGIRKKVAVRTITDLVHIERHIGFDHVCHLSKRDLFRVTGQGDSATGTTARGDDAGFGQIRYDAPQDDRIGIHARSQGSGRMHYV